MTHTLTVSVDVRGDIALVYSPTMKCEFPCLVTDIKPTLSRLVQEWSDLHEAENHFSVDGKTFTVAIGGTRVEESHSTNSYASSTERIHAWANHPPQRGYWWLPMPDGTWLPDTDRNVAAIVKAEERGA